MKAFKNVLLTGGYQLLTMIIPLITSPYISRVLGAKGIGTYTFTGSIVSYFVMFAVLGTATYGNREIAYHQKDKHKRSQVFWGINFLSWITALVAILFYFVFIHFYGRFQ